MSEAKDDSLDGDDREEWDRAWRAMPLRRLLSALKSSILDDLLLGRFGDPISITISQDPPQFSARIWRSSEYCPICGAPTAGMERLAASIHPTWASGFGLAIGTWVHNTCFEDCPPMDGPAPVPW